MPKHQTMLRRGPKRWVIVGHHDQEDNQCLYWSNKDGWVFLGNATVFTDEEAEQWKSLLPVGGTWSMLPEY